MIVIKRTGNREQFSQQKLVQSILAANDETEEYLNESDVKHLVQDLKSILDEKNTVKSAELAIIVIGLLFAQGLRKTVESYTSYAK